MFVCHTAHVSSPGSFSYSYVTSCNASCVARTCDLDQVFYKLSGPERATGFEAETIVITTSLGSVAILIVFCGAGTRFALLLLY